MSLWRTIENLPSGTDRIHSTLIGLEERENFRFQRIDIISRDRKIDEFPLKIKDQSLYEKIAYYF